ncbi:putative protein YphB [Brevundimonas sp. NIBR10]|uniref:aldose 1-epimerase n=1 Tax=Brevundimonas sp. NIBR10 TaxID=3015997 RepID=UPI0022F1BD87|nr:aldose 1-epimerase [Brevundimonas sp. NIBR10]WGM47720.1 putative protein YphB [Brevundimonas sp. NIBR10]
MITLTHGDWRLTVSPDLGASILSLTWQGRDVLRRAPDNASDPLSTGNFPLVPYANRIAQGRFAWDGADTTLPATSGFEPHALHGIGWHRPWTVERQTDHAIRLTLPCEPSPEWPWAWSATHDIALDEQGVTLGLTITNQGDRAMPAGLGLHPYFATEPGTILTLPAPRVWLNGADEIPTRLAEASAIHDWSRGAPVAAAPFVDNAYADWTGTARLTHAGHVVEITASPNARWAQVYAPQGADFICIEPVTHRPDAHNAPPGENSGLVRLDPSQTLEMTALISAFATP